MAGLIPFNRSRGTLAAPGFEPFYDVLEDFFSDARTPVRSLARDTFKIDVTEQEDGYTILAELPGVAKEEIALQLGEDARLTIAVNREEQSEDSQKNYIHRERRLSSMSRSIYLGDADPQGIHAKLDNGILSIEVAKKQKTDQTINISID